MAALSVRAVMVVGGVIAGGVIAGGVIAAALAVSEPASGASASGQPAFERHVAVSAPGPTISVSAPAPIRVTDGTGATTELAAPARRIVSLAPHATELLFAAGAGERVVGVVKGSDAPAAAARLPRIGDVNGLDLERIVALQPDLIVTWPYTTPAQVALLRSRGIAVFTTDAHQVDDIARDLESLGTLAGTSSVAGAAARSLRERAAALTGAAAGRRLVRVFYQVSSAPVFTIGGNHLIDAALTACGGINVFGDVPIPAPQVDVEAVIARHPDAIVAATTGARRPAWLDAWRAWPQIPAVAASNLLVVDADRLHRAGPRFVDGMAELCAALEQVRLRKGG
jgi:iron complex transport system substrate-binding protein